MVGREDKVHGGRWCLERILRDAPFLVYGIFIGTSQRVPFPKSKEVTGSKVQNISKNISTD